jgi:quinol monooxygenase YgiN
MTHGPYRSDQLNHVVEIMVKADRVDDFKSFMKDYLPGTAAYDGCDYIALVQSNGDPQKFFFFETWRSAEVLAAYHQWRGRNEALGEMFAGPPKANQCSAVFVSTPENAS